MDSLVVPDIDLLRRWLDQQNITWFECDACQALHLPHMQNFDGVFDAKSIWSTTSFCFRRWLK